ncbi:MAG: hypothetical protein HOV78_20275 [Hamadaea sp.]|nr:hypothetical protein [Hamadaea sp.]NUO90618.1 hypothetical protein [Dermatophilaceae bacterium]
MSRPPDPWPRLSRDLKALSDRLNELARRSPWFGTGAKPNGLGGIDSDNYVESVRGYRLAETPEFNDIRLRGGIIGNDALTSPVIQSVARNRVTGFGLTTSYVELAGVDVVVPSLCTQVLANVNASVFAYNPNTTGGSNGTGGDAYYVIAAIGGQSTNGEEPLGVSGNGGYTTVRTADTFIITGLTPGQTIRLSVYGASAYASVASNAANVAKVSAGLSFLR